MAQTLPRPARIANKKVTRRLPALVAQGLQKIFDERLHGLIIVPKLQTVRQMKGVLE
jgi:hypothetical protein